MTPARGKLGEGNRKLSPSSANNIIAAQIAKLPPAVKNTFYLLIEYPLDGNILAMLYRAYESPAKFV